MKQDAIALRERMAAMLTCHRNSHYFLLLLVTSPDFEVVWIPACLGPLCGSENASGEIGEDGGDLELAGEPLLGFRVFGLLPVALGIFVVEP